MTKKELKAQIEALEQRVAVLEARNAPLRMQITPWVPYDQRGPQCGTVTATKPDPEVWSIWYSGRDISPNTFYTS